MMGLEVSLTRLVRMSSLSIFTVVGSLLKTKKDLRWDSNSPGDRRLIVAILAKTMRCTSLNVVKWQIIKLEVTKAISDCHLLVVTSKQCSTWNNSIRDKTRRAILQFHGSDHHQQNKFQSTQNLINKWGSNPWLYSPKPALFTTGAARPNSFHPQLINEANFQKSTGSYIFYHFNER